MSAKPQTESNKPGLAQPVIVRTPQQINGQHEHAAIITQVVSDDVVNVMLLPGSGDPYPVSGVPHFKAVGAGGINWRYPSRVKS